MKKQPKLCDAVHDSLSAHSKSVCIFTEERSPFEKREAHTNRTRSQCLVQVVPRTRTHNIGTNAQLQKQLHSKLVCPCCVPGPVKHQRLAPRMCDLAHFRFFGRTMNIVSSLSFPVQTTICQCSPSDQCSSFRSFQAMFWKRDPPRTGPLVHRKHSHQVREQHAFQTMRTNRHECLFQFCLALCLFLSAPPRPGDSHDTDRQGTENSKFCLHVVPPPKRAPRF